jgi:hypothetical protein
MAFPTFDKQEDVPEAFREDYEEREGKWHPKIEDVSGLKSALKKERDAREKNEKAAKEAAERLAALEAEKHAQAAGLTSEKLAEITRKTEERFKPQLERLTALEAENRSLKLDSQVKSAAAKAEVLDSDDFWVLAGKDFDLTDDGKPIWKEDPTLPLEKAIQSYREKKPYLFKGTQAAGGGAAGAQRAGQNSGGGKSPSQWSMDEKRSYIEANGPDAYRNLLDEEVRSKSKVAA